MNLGKPDTHPPNPMPLTIVALNMNGMAPAYSGAVQCGHAYGQLFWNSKFSSPGTRLARGV
jgi:hypothetical protein